MWRDRLYGPGTKRASSGPSRPHHVPTLGPARTKADVSFDVGRGNRPRHLLKCAEEASGCNLLPLPQCVTCSLVDNQLHIACRIPVEKIGNGCDIQTRIQWPALKVEP